MGNATGNKTMELPTLTLVNEEKIVSTKKAPGLQNLEHKVVLNSALLLTTNDTTARSIRKVAECLADAVGMSVDFTSLAA